MKLPFPKKLNQFPLYIVFYWLVLWGIVLAFGVVRILATETPDGRYIKKVNCVKVKVVSQEETCIEYSKPYYIPIGYEINRIFVGSGIIIGVISMGIGYTLMYKVWRKNMES